MRGVCVDPRRMPEDYRTLEERAAKAGMSLPDYLLAELRKSKAKPTPEELWQRIRSRTPIHGVSGTELVRAGREERERQIAEWVDQIGSRR